MQKINIAIAEDQHLFRESLHALLLSEKRFDVVMKEENGLLFLEKLKTADELPHIALIDLNMPGMNGIELTKILQDDFPGINVIILSSYTQDRIIGKTISSGACAYLNKNCDADELFTAIDAVYKNGLYLTREVLRSVQAASGQTKNFTLLENRMSQITKREKEILQLICQEYNNAEIAEKLFLSIRTVEGHRNNLLLKSECRNTAGLVLFAIKHGIVDFPFL
ncbi:response regulator [Pedobacter sp. AW31-3R]|uniref:response regulator n=1 Tax=Pedobacter sp. AW31-3R TaxID=3445781 RepID=UPI003F9F2141